MNQPSQQSGIVRGYSARLRIVIPIGLALLLAIVGCAKPVPMAQATEEAMSTEAPQPADTELPPTPAPTDTPAPEETDMPPVPTRTATPVPEGTARYELTFEATWSADTHPTDFPANPHFSNLIGAVHSPEAVVWAVGGLASPGMKSMAETGGIRLLDREISSLIDVGTACSLISGDGIARSPGSTTLTFSADVSCSQITVVTMVAPSPDWFVGVTGLNLLENGVWADRIVIDLLAWDAGTDSGTSYTSPDTRTDPQEPITIITAPPLLIGDSIPPLGTLTLVRVPDTN